MKDESHGCELIELYKFLGKKWTVPLFHNLKSNPVTYNELNRKTRFLINPTLLSIRIKEFIRFKIVKKSVIDGRISYTLTKRGLKLKDLLHEIKDLAIKWDYNIPDKCKQGICICDTLFEEDHYNIFVGLTKHRKTNS